MKDTDTGGAWAMLLAVLTILGNWKAFQGWGEALGKRWLEGRPKRHLARRFPNYEQLDHVLGCERAERKTLAMIMQARLKADRITVVEYEYPPESEPDRPTLATCILEEREPHIVSVEWQIQRIPLAPEVLAEVQRVHSSPSRSWFIRDVRDIDNTVLRTQLLLFGVHSAYYQSLPATLGHCGAMLSLSWAQPVELSEDDLAGLRWSVRCLGALQRTLWACQPVAA